MLIYIRKLVLLLLSKIFFFKDFFNSMINILIVKIWFLFYRIFLFAG